MPAPGRARTGTLAMRLCTLLSIASLSACASIDLDYPRQESYVPADATHSALGREIDALLDSRPDELSGFYPVPNGIDALSARIVMARRAEKTLDVQYYLIYNDIVGRAFVRELLHAADRGVRVRVLLDDIITVGLDEGLVLVDSHPNIEVRLFNPFRRGALGRPGSALTDFARINRRMHNKSFTADNAVTIVGGRNIADEYFSASGKIHFGDFDVVGVGPVVREVSASFDAYWNHEAAIPVPGVIKPHDDPETGLKALRDRLDKSYADILDSPYADAVSVRVNEYLGDNAGRYTWAPHRFIADAPDKSVKAKAAQASSILGPLLESMRSAERELVLVSPYFVPTDAGIDMFVELEERGVDVRVITNSLAANNQLTVHGAYAKSRKPLLEAGIEIYEVRRDATMMGAEYTQTDLTRTTLHTKGFIVDDREFFIGSFNFDPRSAYLNTELGVIIYDEELARFYGQMVDEFLPDRTYTVFLNDDGKLRWRSRNDGETIVLEKEPDSSWGQRFLAKLIGFLPLEKQL